MQRLPTLTGERLRLRQLGRGDLAALLQLFGDPRVARFMGIPLLSDEDAARRLLADIERGAATGTLFQWGVAGLEDDRVVGTITLFALSTANERAEVGFALAPARWGQGMMREALALLCDHAFDELRLHRLEADVDPRNEPSLRLLERLGFRREGLLRERHLVARERQDSVLLGLLAPAWRARRRGTA